LGATAALPARCAAAGAAARPGGRGGRKLSAAWTKARAALSIAFQPRLRVHLDGSAATFARASAVMIVPGGVEDAFGVSHPQAGPARLETYAFHPRNIGDAASLTMMALAQRWRDHPRVNQAWADTVVLTGRRRIPIMLDGEPESLKPPVRISLAPEAVSFLAPTE
jgi:diacylglycerol kinase family enzyme